MKRADHQVLWGGAALLCALGLVGGCGDDAPTDAATDAADDADARDAEVDTRIDTGPSCDLSCLGGESCCIIEGAPQCVALSDDDENCGRCGIVCAEGRGTECVRGRCVCGGNMLGCAGEDGNLCCPPQREGERSYCANLIDSGNDCGECGNQCDDAVADRCFGGVCRCGAGRIACDGTPTSTCCGTPGIADVGCVDTTSDRQHCGECGNTCRSLSERCDSSVCSLGVGSCEEGCDTGFCCGGECCTRGSCVAGVCEPPADAGSDAADAGEDDAGDAGEDDAGDAGEDDAGGDAGGDTGEDMDAGDAGDARDAG